MKAKIAILTIAAVISLPAFAQEKTEKTFEQQVFSAQTTVNAVELSQAEMKDTKGEGAFVPLMAAGGGFIGAWKHQYEVKKATGQWASPSSTLTAAALGAGTGLSLGKLKAFNSVVLQGGAYGNTKREIDRIRGK